MKKMRVTCLGFWVALFLAGAAAASDAPAVVFEVNAGAHDRRDTPIMVELPSSLRDANGFSLENLDNHTFVPVQTMAYHVKGFFGVAWILRDPLPAHATRRYRLSTDYRNAASRPGGGVHAFADGEPLVHNSGGLDKHRTGTLRVGDRPVLTYQAAVALPPTPIDPVYRRSGFIHPLQSPSGRVVTDDFPPDHAHQHGLFFAWVNSTFEGRSVDFWNQHKQTGRVSQLTPGEVYRNTISGGQVFGELLVELLHEDLTAPGGPKPVLREQWQILVYDIPGHFLVDFESAQHIIDEKLTLNEYHYGGFGLRGSRQWVDPKVQGENPPDPARSGRSDFLTSEGKNRSNGNHTRPRWVDLSGEVDGEFAGITILDNPGNFRFPQPVRIHPNKPYLSLTPPVEGEFAITRGHPYASRYRLLIHDGPPDSKAIERAWHDYSEPPGIRIVEDKR